MFILSLSRTIANPPPLKLGPFKPNHFNSPVLISFPPFHKHKFPTLTVHNYSPPKNNTVPQTISQCAHGTTSCTPAATSSTSANGSTATSSATKSASALFCRRPRRRASSFAFAAWSRRGRRPRRRRRIRGR